MAATASDDERFWGDELIPHPEMHYNHSILVHASPSSIYPWVQQLGKSRGGWYLPTTWERFLPSSWLASHTINPEWTQLKPGDMVPDYGFSKDDFFVVAEVRRDEALVYKSERYGTVFTWAIILLPKQERLTEVKLRFRGRIQSTGVKRKLLVYFGEWMDWASTAPMLRGLKERVEYEETKNR